MNLEDLIARRGLDCIGFVTLTFKENLVDRVEAQRRYHSLATNFLDSELLESICAVERQSRGAIHYHLVCAFPYDIRSGFDFAACRAANAAKKSGDTAEFKRLERIYFASANDRLREWWQRMRAAAERYGFGRCETLPVLSNSEGLARYVGSYVTTEAVNRQARDFRLRTLRYSLDQRAASVNWNWTEGAGRTWRMGCAVLAAVLGTDDFSEVLGKRWSWKCRRTITVFGRHWAEALAAVAEMPYNSEASYRLYHVCSLCKALERSEADVAR